MNPIRLLAGLAFVLAAGGRLTVAWQQHGGEPYAGSSIEANLTLGLINLALGLALFATSAPQRK